MTRLSTYPKARPVRPRFGTPSAGRLVLAALFATALLLTVPYPALASAGLASEPTQLSSSVSVPPGGSASLTAPSPAIALGTHGFPFGRLDAALLVLGSAVLSCLAIGALRVLWYRPLPLPLEPTVRPALPWESPASAGRAIDRRRRSA